MKIEHTTQYVGDFCSALLTSPRVGLKDIPHEAARLRAAIRPFDEMDCEILGRGEECSLQRLVQLHHGLGEIIEELKAEFQARTGVAWTPEMHGLDDDEPDADDILDELRESLHGSEIEDATEAARSKLRRA